MDPNTFPPTTVLPATLTKDERNWAMIAHLSAFAGHIFPFAHIIAPLVVWLLRRDTSAYVDDQGKEAVNAQISVTIYAAAGALLCFVLIGLPILLGLYVANIILIILAAIAASEGRVYRYPFILRLIK